MNAAARRLYCLAAQRMLALARNQTRRRCRRTVKSVGGRAWFESTMSVRVGNAIAAAGAKSASDAPSLQMISDDWIPAFVEIANRHPETGVAAKPSREQFGAVCRTATVFAWQQHAPWRRFAIAIRRAFRHFQSNFAAAAVAMACNTRAARPRYAARNHERDHRPGDDNARSASNHSCQRVNQMNHVNRAIVNAMRITVKIRYHPSHFSKEPWLDNIGDQPTDGPSQPQRRTTICYLNMLRIRS